jgi:hypothetical protein
MPEQMAFMQKQMMDPYHYEDERLDMDLIVPQLGDPADYDEPYAYYSHMPIELTDMFGHDLTPDSKAIPSQPVIDQAQDAKKQQKSKKDQNDDSEYSQFSRYFQNSEL